MKNNIYKIVKLLLGISILLLFTITTVNSQTLNLSGNPTNVTVGVKGQALRFKFSVSPATPPATLINYANKMLSQYGYGWIQAVSVTSNTSGLITVRVAENTTGEERHGVFFSIVIHQLAKALTPSSIKSFSVSGGGKYYFGKKLYAYLSGSEAGVEYRLYRDGTPTDTIQGTGSPLQFSISSSGTYTVKAFKDKENRSMSGSAVVTRYTSLNDIKIVSRTGSMTPDKVCLDWILSSSGMQSYIDLAEIFYSCMKGESNAWNPHFKVTFGYPDKNNNAHLHVEAGPNLTPNNLSARLLLSTSRPPVAFAINQQPGGNILVHNVTGGGSIQPGQSANISLSDKQTLVQYDLYRNDTLVETKNWDEDFSPQNQYGHYTVKAKYEEREVMMNGEAGVWPKVTPYSLGGGGTVNNGEPVTLTLSGSQTILDYYLLCNGQVISKKNGTGGTLSYSVNIPGTYTVQAGIQDYRVSMNGSITVDGFNGLYYSPGKNYIIERTYMEASTSNPNAKFVENVNYLDGFGKKIQEILVQGSPGGNADIIVPHVYGTHGREEKNYLPYSRTGNTGTFDVNAMNTSNWNIYGPSEATYAYSKTTYDNSPLDKIEGNTKPGKNWHTLDKSVKINYKTNETGEVYLFRVTDNGNLVCNNKTFEAGSLQKKITIDEDGCRIEEFTDRNDRKILSVGFKDDTRLETYCVFDKRGLIRYVLPPEASTLVKNTIDQNTLHQYAYYYEYDACERMIVKRFPGCEPIYMLYDKRNRLVMSQDGKQRAENANKWSYCLYDNQNRIVENGEVILSPVKTFSELQTITSTSDNYTPVGTLTALQYTVYDNYDRSPHVTAHPFEATSNYSTSPHISVSGFVTSVSSRVLGTNTWLTTTNYYDPQGHKIQTISNNLQGGISRINKKYDFLGNVIRLKESHQTSANQTDVLETTYSYDNRGRLLSASVTLNGGTPATTFYKYDAVGRLISQKLGTITETMTYNTQGWLTSKTSLHFKMKLRYENPEGGGDACYNGNISEWEWQHDSDTVFMYGFTYDGANRLEESVQKYKNGSSWINYKNHYLEKNITYDRNGNIKTLQRTANGQIIDNLSYTYSGNQLIKLVENVQNKPANDVYLGNNMLEGTYTYDGNGNMITDSRRNFNFSYTVLNLLDEVKTTSGTLVAKYNYLADGTKLSVRDGTSTSANGFDYLGSLTYKKNNAGLKLETAYFGNGVIYTRESNNSSQEIKYFMTDHLGSIRAVIASNENIMERNDYYPFGARHTRKDYPRSDNRLLYNGKEQQVTGELNYLDYGERMYDMTLGTWHNLDLKAQKYGSWSTYAYVKQNPINNIDPDGTSTWVMRNNKGGYTVMKGYFDGDLNIYVYTVENGNEIILGILGRSLTMYSFFNSEVLNPVTGDMGIFTGTIDLLDMSGMLFLNCLRDDNVGLVDYMVDATDGKKYDFKKNGMTKDDDNTYLYRGMIIRFDGNIPIIGSARDVGNVGAGYMAGRHAIPWKVARVAFDRLETRQRGSSSIEGPTTQSAQYIGWQWGMEEYSGNPSAIFLRAIKFIDGVGKHWYKLVTKIL